MRFYFETLAQGSLGKNGIISQENILIITSSILHLNKIWNDNHMNMKDLKEQSSSLDVNMRR